MCQQLPKQESVADQMMCPGENTCEQNASLQGRQGSLQQVKCSIKTKGSMEQLTSKQALNKLIFLQKLFI